MQVVSMTDEHADAVLRIYQDGLDSGQASFETSAPSWSAWQGGRLPQHRFVAVDHTGEVVGWAALSAVSDRCVYAGVAEVSVYVAEGARGVGVGHALLHELVASAEQSGIWTLQAGVFPENVASVRLHERCGFRVVGRRERLGRHEGVGGNRWRDVLLLERRSPVAGIG